MNSTSQLAYRVKMSGDIAERVATRWAALETSEDLLEKIKRLDFQIKHVNDIGRRRAWIIARNKLVAEYNKLTGKVTPKVLARVPTQKLWG